MLNQIPEFVIERLLTELDFDKIPVEFYVNRKVPKNNQELDFFISEVKTLYEDLTQKTSFN